MVVESETKLVAVRSTATSGHGEGYGEGFFSNLALF
jgi:hypothetical protein